MSSHHFVRDEQEPALLILEASSATYACVGPLLEWVPTVIVTQDTVAKVISWGIKIDLILADMDFQRTHLYLLEEQYPVKFLTVKQPDDYLGEAIHYLVATKHPAVNIMGLDHRSIWEVGGRFESLDVVFWDGEVRYFPARNGRLRKWFASGTLQIHAPEGTAVEVITDGEASIVPIHHATMIEVPEGITEFKAQQTFWIGELVSGI